MLSSTKIADHAARENNSPATATATAAFEHGLEELCKPYVDAFFADWTNAQTAAAPRASLHARESNHNTSGDYTSHSRPVKRPTNVAASASLSAPQALLQACNQLLDGAAHPALTRPAAELAIENAYLRALLTRTLQQQQQHAVSRDAAEAVQETGAPTLPSSQLSPARTTHFEGSDSRRSPSAACPEPAARPHEQTHANGDAVHRALLGRTTHNLPSTLVADPRETSPATAFQVGELQEQIELLREAVRELSQQATAGRGLSASPPPGDARTPAFALRAISPSPRCATPTCTTDVPTLQRIILHQQQTIRTLQLEMEEVETAKAQIQQLLHFHEAAVTAGAAEAEERSQAAMAALKTYTRGGEEEEEEEDTPCLLATTHWRSTCHTEDRASGATARQGEAEATPYSPASYTAEAAELPSAEAEVAAGTVTAAEEMYKMDYDAAVEAAGERRRAATYGGTRPTSWFDTTLTVDAPIHLTSRGAGRETNGDDDDAVGEGEEAPSSGMRTPLPRRTVVLRPLQQQQRYSSATGDSASVTGRPTDESPVMGPAKSSYGTASYRRTSAMSSNNGL